MAKPWIGVTPLWDEDRDSYWMLPGYLQGIEAAGGLPVMLPMTTDEEILRALVQRLDGFLFTGGHDVSPAVYGAAPTPQCGTPCPARDAMETRLLELTLAADKPILGICRGIQLLNACLGGTLYQDLPTDHPSTVDHHMTPPYDRAVHTVTLVPGTQLAALLGAETLGVNSYHHQGVDRLAPGLQVMATAADGLTEAVCMPGKRFVWAVQWHPEFSYRTDASALAILRAFVAAAGQGSAAPDPA